MKLIAAATLALAIGVSSAHADLVSLTNGRTLRAVGVVRNGAQTTLTLSGGATMTVATASIQSVKEEPVSSELCAASPYRCQDRAMLLSRRGHAASHPAPAPAPQP